MLAHSAAHNELSVIVNHRCGCQTDYGIVDQYDRDAALWHAHLLDRFLHWHEHTDPQATAVFARTLTPEQLHEHMKTIGHLFRPQLVLDCGRPPGHPDCTADPRAKC